jgi:hypothetical protein
MSGIPAEQRPEEAFIKITFKDEREDENKDPLYPLWTRKSRCHHFNRMLVLITTSSLCTLERPVGLCVSGLRYILALMSLNSLLNCRTSKLRELYPGHSVVTSMMGGPSILEYPAAYVQSLRPDLMVSECVFVPYARRTGTPGALVEQVSYGCFYVVWEVWSTSAGLRTLTELPSEIHFQTLCRNSRLPRGSIIIRD